MEEIVYIHKIPNSKGVSTTFDVSDKGFGVVFIVPCKDVNNLEEYCKGLLKGILLAKGTHINNIVFQPADDIEFSNTIGQPIYVYRNIDRGKEEYVFHIFFDTQGETLKRCKFEYIVINKG